MSSNKLYLYRIENYNNIYNQGYNIGDKIMLLIKGDILTIINIYKLCNDNVIYAKNNITKEYITISDKIFKFDHIIKKII
jgi:hypothetical protein